MGDDGSLNVEEFTHRPLSKVPAALRLTLAKGIAALEWSDFESLAAAIFEMLGYEVRRTPPTNDQGVDLMLTEKKSGILDVVQCKHWKDQVGSPVVRDFYGAMIHFQARRGFLISTGGLTDSGREFVSGKPIVVWGPDELIDEIFRIVIRQGPLAGRGRSRPDWIKSPPNYIRSLRKTCSERAYVI